MVDSCGGGRSRGKEVTTELRRRRHQGGVKRGGGGREGTKMEEKEKVQESMLSYLRLIEVLHPHAVDRGPQLAGSAGLQWYHRATV